MDFISKITDFLKPRAPKVSCPRCKELHDINAESKCPKCGLKYTLPPEYAKYIPKQQTAPPVQNTSENIHNQPVSKEKNLSRAIEMRDKALHETGRIQKRKASGRMIKLAFSVVLMSVVFFFLSLIVFKDKDALLFKVGEYKNQPVFYTTEDATLKCVFPNEKGCNIGKGTIHSYLSSANGKCVYITYTGTFRSDKTSNYVLRISDFGKNVEKILENKDYIPKIAAGGDNKYLYIMTPTDGTGTIHTLTRYADGKKDKELSKIAKELAVSTSGRYALISENDNGASKLIIHSVAKDEPVNPGIKNAHPLSIDNKGEYLIYAKKPTPNSTDIVSEKLNGKKVVVPMIPNAELKEIIFSEDRRSFAMNYTDRTVFYTCGNDDYIPVTDTDGNSVFSYDYNSNVSHNIYSFVEIPSVTNVHGTDFLPFFYYDKEHKYIYRITEQDGQGVKETVFGNHLIDDLKVSENNRVAFVSGGKLYTGKLDKKNNDLCEIMNFANKHLVDITPDGKSVYYTDSDGKMFITAYGKKVKKPQNAATDPDTVKYAENGKYFITVSDNSAHIVSKKGKSKKLCENIIPEFTVISEKNLSEFFYAVSYKNQADGTEKKKLYLYSGGKSKEITDKLSGLCLNKDELRIDRTRSYYVNTAPEIAAPTPETVGASGTAPADNTLPAVTAPVDTVTPAV